MRTERRFYVYMMTSSSRRALYIGITNNLVRRVWEHKTGSFAGFASQYRTTRLVYYECSGMSVTPLTGRNNSSVGDAKKKWV